MKPASGCMRKSGFGRLESIGESVSSSANGTMSDGGASIWRRKETHRVNRDRSPSFMGRRRRRSGISIAHDVKKDTTSSVGAKYFIATPFPYAISSVRSGIEDRVATSGQRF